MARTKLIDRLLPNYSTGEEIFNMVTHIVGGGFGVVMLVLCVAINAVKASVSGVLCSIVYGLSTIMLYTMSSIYHGLRTDFSKKVFQVIDHCTIYFMIAGTYTPVLICSVRKTDPVAAWVIFGVVWGLTALAVTFTAIDLKESAVFSMACYIGMGWSIVFALDAAIKAVGVAGLLLFLAGGILYTIGAILYGIGKKKKHMHGIFHVFVVLASIIQGMAIIFFVLLKL